MTRKNLKTFDKEQCLKGGLSKVKPKGAFNNYVDRILPFFDPPPSLRGQFLYPERGHFDPLPPYLVHVLSY